MLATKGSLEIVLTQRTILTHLNVTSESSSAQIVSNAAHVTTGIISPVRVASFARKSPALLHIVERVVVPTSVTSIIARVHCLVGTV